MVRTLRDAAQVHFRGAAGGVRRRSPQNQRLHPLRQLFARRRGRGRRASGSWLRGHEGRGEGPLLAPGHKELARQ